MYIHLVDNNYKKQLVVKEGIQLVYNRLTNCQMRSCVGH